ncbi:hypothetical protein Bbelb_199640 [Branchiostoma belcheri]|nr:hypothetical protein Bbelb_199640 [Branchiostoma belcheri]
MASPSKYDDVFLREPPLQPEVQLPRIAHDGAADQSVADLGSRPRLVEPSSDTGTKLARSTHEFKTLRKSGEVWRRVVRTPREARARVDHIQRPSPDFQRRNTAETRGMYVRISVDSRPHRGELRPSLTIGETCNKLQRIKAPTNDSSEESMAEAMEKAVEGVNLHIPGRCQENDVRDDAAKNGSDTVGEASPTTPSDSGEDDISGTSKQTVENVPATGFSGCFTSAETTLSASTKTSQDIAGRKLEKITIKEVNGHVVLYIRNGRLKKKFEVRFLDRNRVQYPAIAMDTHNNKVIVGDEDIIMLFHPNGTLYRSIDTEAPRQGIMGVTSDRFIEVY